MNLNDRNLITNSCFFLGVRYIEVNTENGKMVQ